MAQTDATFRKWCLPCHDAGDGAKIKLGPPLNGIDGRKAGTFEGYNYSDAMKGSGITWDEAVFKEYIALRCRKSWHPHGLCGRARSEGSRGSVGPTSRGSGLTARRK